MLPTLAQHVGCGRCARCGEHAAYSCCRGIPRLCSPRITSHLIRLLVVKAQHNVHPLPNFAAVGNQHPLQGGTGRQDVHLRAGKGSKLGSTAHLGQEGGAGQAGRGIGEVQQAVGAQAMHRGGAVPPPDGVPKTTRGCTNLHARAFQYYSIIALRGCNRSKQRQGCQSASGPAHGCAFRSLGGPQVFEKRTGVQVRRYLAAASRVMPPSHAGRRQRPQQPRPLLSAEGIAEQKLCRSQFLLPV